ncbi:MAG: dihydrodipicolinate synthase family protein [Acidobacteria bacterium]|nr:dihydrodipicolinate synthase family protein [Acidobacteriota bacterium]
MGRLALEKGARALLLPMPYFFPYTQDDLACFCATVAAELAAAPILLYNLPRFTTALSVDTVRSLLAEVPNLAGIKDSSESLEILRALSGGPDSRASRIVGDDTVLVPACENASAMGSSRAWPA